METDRLLGRPVTPPLPSTLPALGAAGSLIGALGAFAYMGVETVGHKRWTRASSSTLIFALFSTAMGLLQFAEWRKIRAWRPLNSEFNIQEAPRSILTNSPAQNLYKAAVLRAARGETFSAIGGDPEFTAALETLLKPAPREGSAAPVAHELTFGSPIAPPIEESFDSAVEEISYKTAFGQALEAVRNLRQQLQGNTGAADPAPEGEQSQEPHQLLISELPPLVEAARRTGELSAYHGIAGVLGIDTTELVTLDLLSNQIRQQMDAKNEALEAVEGELAGAKAQIEALKKKTNKAKQAAAANADGISELEEETRALQQELAAKDGTIAKLEQANAKLKKRDDGHKQNLNVAAEVLRGIYDSGFGNTGAPYPEIPKAQGVWAELFGLLGNYREALQLRASFNTSLNTSVFSSAAGSPIKAGGRRVSFGSDEGASSS